VKLLGAIAFELVRVGALVGLAAAAAWSFRVAVSDYYASAVTVSGLEQAIAWSPGQSLNYVRLSALITETDPGKAEDLLQRAVTLNPLDSRSWIDLALRHEMDGNLPAAERELLRAAGVEVGPFSMYVATAAVLGKSPGATAIACSVSLLQVNFTGPV